MQSNRRRETKKVHRGSNRNQGNRRHHATEYNRHTDQGDYGYQSQDYYGYHGGHDNYGYQNYGYPQNYDSYGDYSDQDCYGYETNGNNYYNYDDNYHEQPYAYDYYRDNVDGQFPQEDEICSIDMNYPSSRARSLKSEPSQSRPFVDSRPRGYGTPQGPQAPQVAPFQGDQRTPDVTVNSSSFVDAGGRLNETCHYRNQTGKIVTTWRRVLGTVTCDTYAKSFRNPAAITTEDGKKVEGRQADDARAYVDRLLKEKVFPMAGSSLYQPGSMRFHVCREDEEFDEEDDQEEMIGGVLMDHFGSLLQVAQNRRDDAMEEAEGDSVLVSFIKQLRRHQTVLFDQDQIEQLVSEANDLNNIPNKPRLNKDQIEKLPCILFNKCPTQKECEEERCSICLVVYNDQEKVKQLPCKHIYHQLCIDTWLARNTYCPVCKNDTAQALKVLHD